KGNERRWRQPGCKRDGGSGRREHATGSGPRYMRLPGRLWDRPALWVQTNSTSGGPAISVPFRSAGISLRGTPRRRENGGGLPAESGRYLVVEAVESAWHWGPACRVTH